MTSSKLSRTAILAAALAVVGTRALAAQAEGAVAGRVYNGGTGTSLTGVQVLVDERVGP